MAKKASPGRSVRVSIESPPTSRGTLPARAAPMAAAMSSEVQSGSLT
jgi:hypothetical protein